VRLKIRYADAGFQLCAIESRPPMHRARLGLPGRHEEFASACELLHNLGRLGIPVWCYNWNGSDQLEPHVDHHADPRRRAGDQL
jgi:mannonate dehydratase